MLKLEAGKRYPKRDGTLSGVLESRSDGGDYIWWDGKFYYLATGRVFSDANGADDIISDTADSEADSAQPQPLEWKRGIPTEEECRECWILSGNHGDFPNSSGCVYEPKEVGTPLEHFTETLWYLPLRIKPVEPPKPKTRTVTQRQYFNSHGSELWTHMEVLETFWTPSTLTRTREVPCE